MITEPQNTLAGHTEMRARPYHGSIVGALGAQSSPSDLAAQYRSLARQCEARAATLAELCFRSALVATRTLVPV